MSQAEDLEAAIELASRIPAARMGGAVEVRPFVEGLAILERVRLRFIGRTRRYN